MRRWTTLEVIAITDVQGWSRLSKPISQICCGLSLGLSHPSARAFGGVGVPEPSTFWVLSHDTVSPDVNQDTGHCIKVPVIEFWREVCGWNRLLMIVSGLSACSIALRRAIKCTRPIPGNRSEKNECTCFTRRPRPWFFAHAASRTRAPGLVASAGVNRWTVEGERQETVRALTV